MASLFKN